MTAHQTLERSDLSAIDNLALYIEHKEIYRFRGAGAEAHVDQAYADLRDRACPECRDPDQQELEPAQATVTGAAP